MIKKCYVLNGEIINVGEWDYQKTINEQGEEVINNPLPEGANEEERDFEYTEERGWFDVGTVPQPSEIEILQAKLNSATQQLDFQEELIVEMAMLLY